MKKILIYIIFCCSFIALNAQNESNEEEQKTQEESTQTSKSYAWTLMEPLGLREESTIDTLLYNYYHKSVPSGVSPAYATTGNLGAEGLNMLYFERKPMSDFFFKDALSAWMPNTSTLKFYNTRLPMTLLSYNT